MISYDNYLNRIQKIAKFKNFVHKFRFLFIGVFSLIFAATAGLLIAKGTVTTAMSLPATIEYGTPYEPTPASAFLSPVSYEYSLEGSGEWSSQKPIKAGKYLARTVTQKTVGKGYSDPVHFEITPLEVDFTIGATSVVYGGIPANCNLSKTVYGQTLSLSDLIFEYESYTQKITNVFVDEKSVKITDSTGEDFTSCYKINFESVKSGVELEILPRNISLQADSVTTTYSGSSFEVKNEVSENSLKLLARGDEITVINGVFDGSGTEVFAPKNSGNYYIKVKSYKIMHGSDDVTQHYSVNALDAILKINTREITITTGSGDKVYDGKELKNTQFTYDSGLISGHTITAQNEYISITDAGEITNVNSFKIFDGYEDVTQNYNIKPVFGTLKVTKRAITVKTGDAEREYDGDKLFNYNYELLSGSIADGQSVTTNEYGIFNVGESGDNGLLLTINDAYGTPVTYNYEIKYVFGKLTLTPRNITIKTEGDEREYNSFALSNESHSISKGSLVTGHKEISVNSVYITNAGSIQNGLVFKIYDNNGYGEDVTKNYNIGYDYGTLTVTPRPIVIITGTPDNDFIFNGEGHYYEGFDTAYAKDERVKGLLYGDTLTVSGHASIRDVGETPNELTFYENGNYEITRIDCGTLKVVPRPITVVTSSPEWTYDGEAHSDSSFITHYYGNINDFGLLESDNDKLRLIGVASIVGAGSIANTCESYELSSANYEIKEISSGTLTVYKRTLEIVLSDITLKYGEIIEYPYASAYKSAQGLVSGERIEVFVNFVGVKEGVINPADTYTATLDFENTKIYDKNGKDSRGNYSVTFTEATLTIENRLLTVTTGTAEKEYDGDILFSEEISISGTLAEGQRYEITFRREICDVDQTYEGNNDSTIDIFDEYNNRVTENYDIEYICGTLTVTPRLIYYTTPSQEWVYDATVHSSYENYTTAHFPLGDKGLIFDDEELILISFATITDAGEKDNECVFAVPNSNYYIVGLWCSYGKLTITARPITIQTPSDEWIYDGEEHFNYTDYKTFYGSADGLLNGDELIVVSYAKITNVGDGKGIQNKCDYKVPNANYAIVANGYVYGTLKITPRPIVVVTDSAEKEYDGTPLSCITYKTYKWGDRDAVGLIDGDGLLNPTFITYRTKAGSEDNVCKFEVPSNNYVIADYEYGTLTIKPKAVTVVISRLESVTYGETFAYPSHIGNYDSAEGLAEGEILRIAVYYMKDGVRVTPKNAGTYEVVLDIENTLVYDSSRQEIEDGISNYLLSAENIRAEILRKDIEVSIESDETIYGEGEDFRPRYTLEIAPEDMPYGEEIKLGFIYWILTSNGELLIYDLPVNVGVYRIVQHPSKSTVYLNGDEIVGGISNYRLSRGEAIATVTVNPRPITVELSDISGVEYGEDYYYEIREGNYKNLPDLVYGDTLTVIPDLSFGVMSVGTYYEYVKAIEEKTLINGVEDTSNYEIEYVGGNLEIVQRAIIVTNLGAEKKYYGTALSNGEYTTRSANYPTKAGLLGDDTLELDGELVSITNVWESGTPNANRYQNSENYEIVGYEDNELIITPKSIVIEIGDVDDVTYGETFNYPAGRGNFKNAETCGLAEGDELEIAVIYYKLAYVDDLPSVIGWYEEDGTPIEQPQNAGTYKVTLDIQRTKIYKDGDELEDGLSNYFIAVETTTATINRKYISLTLKSEEIIYGEGEDFVPEYSFDVAPEDMPYGEELGFKYFQYYIDKLYYSPCHVGEYMIRWQGGITVYKDDIEVVDGVYNYWVSLSEPAYVTVTPKEITVELLDIEGVEYGNDYSYPEYEGNYKNSDTLDLPYGDILTVYQMIVGHGDWLSSVGTYYGCIDADEERTLVNGVADTSDYKITYISGNLEIVQREIIVTNLGAEKVYDGTSLSNGEYTTRSANYPSKAGLLDDELVLDGELISITFVWESGTLNENRYTVGDNYKIVGYEDEPLEIIPRKIVIATDSGEWEYDGEYHYLDSFNEDESYYYNEETGEKEPALVLDHCFVALIPAKIKDVGSIRNVSLGENEIYDGDGNPVTENYEIDVTNSGYLTITPRHIVVRTHSDTKVYDGTPLTCEEYSTYYYIDGGYGQAGSAYDESEKGLIDGDELILKNGLPIYATYVWENSVLNMNEYESPIGEYDNANYVIEYTIFGYLIVTHREITVEIDDIIKEYDCAPYIIDGEDYSVENLADYESLQIAIKFTDEDGNEISSDERFNVGVYGILLDTENCVIYRDGEILERGIENYAIICDGSTLTINKRQVTITQKDIEAVYGDEIIYNGYEGGEDIPYYKGVQDELTFNYGYYYKDDLDRLVLLPENIRVGTYVIHVNEGSVLVNGESPYNYEFEFVDGTLTITPREVDVVLKDQSVTYGDELIYPDGTNSFEPVELPYGDTLQVFIKALADERLNAGTYFEYIVADEERTLVNGESDTSDYIFNYISGALYVDKRGIRLELTAPDRNYVYGEIYSYATGIGNYESVENLAYNEQLEVAVLFDKDGEYFAEPKNAGNYVMFVSELIIFDEFGNLIDNNYYIEDIDSVAVPLTVEWLWISVELHDREYIYGNEAPEITFSILDYYTREEIDLPFGDVMTFEYRYANKSGGGHNLEAVEDAGEYWIMSGTALTYINGEPWSTHANYNMNVVRSTLTIHKRQIVVETATSSHLYDGNPYSDPNVYAYFYDENDPENREIAGFVKGYTPEIDLSSVPTVTNVSEGRVENRFDFTISENYEIVGEISYGEIWITAKTLYIELYDDLSIIYGEEFAYPAGVGNYKYQEGLVDGESLEVFVQLVAIKELPDIGTYEIAGIKELTLINGVLNSDYEIIIISGLLEIKAREIYITSAPEVIEYDGEYHSPSSNIDEDNSYHINSNGEIESALVSGHRFEVIAPDRIKDVGTIPNGSLKNNRIFDEEGNDVTDNYAIAAENLGTLTIIPRKIKVTTVDQSKTYDGAALVGEYTVSHAYYDDKEAIVEGDWEVITVIYAYITNVWQSGTLNMPLFIFPEGESGNVNYEIIEELCSYGRLEITQKQISIEIGEKSKEYDAKYYEFASGENVYTDGLAEGESLHIAISFENADGTPVARFNVGEYTVLLDRENSRVYKDGSEISRGVENYEISCENSTLTITKRNVTVYVNDASEVYGNEIFWDGFETDRPMPSYTGNEEISFTYHIENQAGERVSGILEVGSYFICADEESAEILAGSIDNYNLNFVNGTLTITKRYLILSTESAEKVYDGTPLSYEVFRVILSDGLSAGLLEGDSLTLTNWASLVEVGEILNSCDYEVPNSNYEVLVARFGTLKVTQAELKIVLHDVESVDYGQRLSYPTDNGGYESVEGLFEGETLTVEIYYTDADGNVVTPRNAGEYYVHVDTEKSKVEGTEKGLGNYFVSYEPKIAVINRLKVTLALKDVEYEYDSTAHGYEQSDYNIVDGNTVYGEFFNVFVTYYKDGVQLSGAPKNAGEYQIKLDTPNCLVNGGYMNANLNYVLECEEEFYNYVILKAKFSVTLDPEPAEIIYYGDVFDYKSSGGFIVEGLKGTDEIECNVKYYLDGEETEPKNAGTYSVVFDTENIVFLRGDAENYIFDGSDGNYITTLIIRKRSIRVTVSGREIEYEVAPRPDDESYKAVWTYDGYEVPGVAFVSADEEAAAGAVFSYKDGSGAPMRGSFETGGLYYITVEFINGEITKNYEIEVVDGILTVTGRKVLVTPVYNGGIRTYNGYAVDVDELVRQGLLYPEHVHDIENAAASDRYGFKPEDFEKLTFVYEFEDANSGDRYENGATPRNAGYYYISIKIYGVDESKYAVETTRRLDYFIINPATIEVTAISSLTKEYDKSNFADIRISYSGLLDVDAATCYIAPLYILKSTGKPASYLDAGEYEVGAKVVDPSGAENYTIIYRCAKGTLIITPITLYIKPASKSEYYQGRNISLSSSDYLFVDKENGKYTNLLAGDEITIIPSAYLEPTKTSVTVTISGASVFDRNRGVYTTQNYILKYAYEKAMGTDYSSSDFKGILEYKVRTVYYKQIVPAGQSSFTYDGEVKKITGNKLYEIVSGKGDGLYSTDEIRVASASVGPQVGQYYNWLTLNVWDTRNNRDVSRVYNLVLENADESVITIGLLKATVTIKSTLTLNMLENKQAGYLSAKFDGRLVVDKRYYEVDGIKTELNHEYEIIAIKSKGVWNLALVIFESKASGSLTDRSESYDITFVKEGNIDVVCKLVECHSLTTIPSDITLTVKLSYAELIAGEVLTSYEERPALKASQYEVEGLLSDHVVSQVLVYRSNGKLTFVVLITNGKSDRSYYYNLVCELPSDYPTGEVVAVLASNIAEVKMDVTLTITADLSSILAGQGLTKTYDNRLALDGSYTADGLLSVHTMQIIPMMINGKVTLAVLIFEAKYTNGVMSGRSDRSYLYNLVVKVAPQGAEVTLISSLSELTTDIKITLSSSVTIQNLKNGVGVTRSDIDGRRILDSSMFTLENYFGASPLATNHYVEIVVDGSGDNFNLYVVVYQRSSSGKRSDRSYLYSVKAENVQSGITVNYISTADLGNAGLN